MTDERERLRRASEHLPTPDRAFERMLDRRDRKRRHERVAATAVALVVAFAVIGGVEHIAVPTTGPLDCAN
jgi:ferric-dicitrate binding protein FerR (iron transport regulator)